MSDRPYARHFSEAEGVDTVDCKDLFFVSLHASTRRARKLQYLILSCYNDICAKQTCLLYIYIFLKLFNRYCC